MGETPSPSGAQGAQDIALLAFARYLRRVDDYDALVEVVRAEVHARFGITNAWLYVFEGEGDDSAVLVAAAGPKAEAIRRELPVAPVAGDWLTDALRRDEAPIVIPDARRVEGNPEVAERLGNRTVVNMPVGVVDSALGILGCGTFDDDGVVEFDESALNYFVQLANITAVAAARLVVRARDRAREQLQTQLAQRQRLESLGLLAGGVAHDFNNLLTVIRVSAGFLAAGELAPAQRSDLTRIADAERSAGRLTKKLSLLGRQEPPSFTNADLNRIVTEFLELIARLIPANIQIDFAAGQALPLVRTDPHQIEQVLTNLTLNARDAMPNGGRLGFETRGVVVNGEYRRAHPWARAGRYVVLTITDTGTGMPPEVVSRVFEPFFTTKPQGMGTGLGLSVTWGIVQQHGGMIHCYSELGVGTSFRVYIPVAETLADEVVSKLQGPVPRGSERILVADDQPEVLAVIERVLASAGYAVTGAKDGALAVEASLRDRFDLFVLDAIMPNLGGREACERIRALHPDASFLFVTGYGGDSLPASFLADQRIEVVQKPFDPESLLRSVRAALDARRS